MSSYLLISDNLFDHIAMYGSTKLNNLIMNTMSTTNKLIKKLIKFNVFLNDFHVKNFIESESNVQKKNLRHNIIIFFDENEFKEICSEILDILDKIKKKCDKYKILYIKFSDNDTENYKIWMMVLEYTKIKKFIKKTTMIKVFNAEYEMEIFTKN